MRNTILGIIIVAVAAATPVPAATRNFGITGFTKIRVDGPFRISLATGVAPFARATGSPQAVDRVAIDVRGDTLVVHLSGDTWGGYPGTDPGPVEVTVGTHELSQAWLNGAGLLAIDGVKGLSFGLSVQGSGVGRIDDVAADELNVSLVGTANAQLGGTTHRLVAVVRGLSTLDAAKLDTRDATLGAEGAATIDARVSNAAAVDATGPATVRLSGSPSCTLKTSGSASVSGCR
jgi:hypothetical protein